MALSKLIYTKIFLGLFILLSTISLKAEDKALFVLYPISQGETIYSIARNFDLSASDIMQLNNIQHVATDVKIGDTLLIPFSRSKIETLIGKDVLVTDKTNRYKIHQVQAGETFFSLSRKYNTTTEVLQQINPILRTSSLQPGQLLFISEKPVETAVFAQEVVSTDNLNIVRHEVQPGETLFSIARKYGFQNPNPIRQRNNLTSNELQPGQVLLIETEIKEAVSAPQKPGETYHTVQAGETLFAIARKFNHQNPQKIREWNQLTTDELSPGQRLVVHKTESHSTVEESKPEELTVHQAPTLQIERVQAEPEVASISPLLEAYRKEFLESAGSQTNFVEKRGIASWIEDTGNEENYLALTNEAPIGSVLRLKNLMNNQETYVKVIGRMPATGRNTNLLIKVSESAARNLNVLDSRFLVEISIPER